jgi:3-dehydroquinate dehydratase-2
VAQSILVINGPNLNLLGQREPGIYGHANLASVEQALDSLALRLGVQVRHLQSNHEGVLIDAIHAARSSGVDFLIINAGGFTHTSVALRDAIAGVALPCIEVHISNVHRREPFRHQSYLSDLAIGSIVGLGVQGYEFALTFAARHQPEEKRSGTA